MIARLQCDRNPAVECLDTEGAAVGGTQQPSFIVDVEGLGRRITIEYRLVSVVCPMQSIFVDILSRLIEPA